MYDIELVAEESVGCTVCLGGHDEEIHAATLSIHQWLRQEVTKWIDDEDIPLDDEPVEYFLFNPTAA